MGLEFRVREVGEIQRRNSLRAMTRNSLVFLIASSFTCRASKVDGFFKVDGLSQVLLGASGAESPQVLCRTRKTPHVPAILPFLRTMDYPLPGHWQILLYSAVWPEKIWKMRIKLMANVANTQMRPKPMANVAKAGSVTFWRFRLIFRFRSRAKREPLELLKDFYLQA